MAHHKRGRPKNRRGGCLYCKRWKANGVRNERKDGERFSDHLRRFTAWEQVQDVLQNKVPHPRPGEK